MPVPGHVNPTLPVVRELVARGRRVRYFTSDALSPVVASAGAEPVSYGARIGPEVMRPSRSLTGLAAETQAAGAAVLPLVLDDFERDPPALIAYDSMCTWGHDAARAHRGPALCLTATFALHRELLPEGERPPGLLHRGEDPTIVFSSRALQPRPELFGPEVRWTGYPPVVAAGEVRRPLVYVSLGTLFNERPEFFAACARALNGTGGVVMAVGRADPAAIGRLPGGVSAQPFVTDQADRLRRARLFVTHGGLNSVSEALLAGTPMLVYPQTAEQQVNATRLAELGAARILADPSATGIHTAAEAVLADGRATGVATELGHTLRRGGAAAAADAFERAL